MDTSLLILAAGMGSRYGGLKQIDPIAEGGHALLEYTIYDAIAAGFKNIVFVVRKEIADEVSSFYNRKIEGRAKVQYVNQDIHDIPSPYTVPPGRNKPWGTVHAIYAAREVIQEPFAVVNSDDYYGRHAIQLLYRYLSGVDPDSREYAMVGYLLSATISHFGSVSRGICEVNDQECVTAIEENKRVIEEEGAAMVSIDENGRVLKRFPADQLASMNIFGFTPRFMQDAEEDLRSFLLAQAKDGSAELYIPSVLNKHIRTGRVRLRILGKEDRWFGVTYREDKKLVADSLQDLTEKGVYPSALWER